MREGDIDGMKSKRTGCSLIVESTRKGSNPGGLCTYRNGKNNFQGYFKYCIGSRISNTCSNLHSDHQPIYEAITFELARRFGLRTPPFFVLLNKKNDATFQDSRELVSHDHSGRPFYFLSKIIYESKNLDREQAGSEIIEKQRVYLDALMISDILGKRQNYMILGESGDYQVSYVDLGCSFVHATEGFIRLPNDLKKYKEIPRNREKNDKHRLKNKTVISADNDSLVNLEELVYGFRGLTIPTLNPWRRIPIRDLLSEEEVEEIDDYLVHGLCKNLHNFNEKGLLL